MALEHAQVTADVIEANEFAGYSERYAVQAVPKTVVNDQLSLVGALPEARFVQEVLKVFPGDTGGDTGETETASR